MKIRVPFKRCPFDTRICLDPTKCIVHSTETDPHEWAKDVKAAAEGCDQRGDKIGLGIWRQGFTLVEDGKPRKVTA